MRHFSAQQALELQDLHQAQGHKRRRHEALKRQDLHQGTLDNRVQLAAEHAERQQAPEDTVSLRCCGVHLAVAPRNTGP